MDKYWEPQKIRSRHLSIMEVMLANPQMNQNEIAAMLNFTPSRLSIIVNSPLFVYAMEGYRRKHMDKLSDLVAEATTEALKFSTGVLKNQNEATQLRQTSARDILALGHAKAVEKTASLALSASVPPELLAALGPILEEIKQPFAPKRFFVKPPEKSDEAAESSEAP